MLIGRTTDEARDLVEKYLDDAFMAGLANVRLIHGKGTGALRKAVRSVLSDHPLVESFRDGEPRRGRRRRHRGGDQGLLMASYAPGLLDEIRAGVDIVDLVGRFVNLAQAGQNWKGLCPFHGEKTPSFMVNPKKGIFHCFGCGVGGDAFGFLMRQDRLSFPEAVRALAKQANVALPEDRGPRPADSGREELFRVMELAASFYTERLWTAGGERARAYLERARHRSPSSRGASASAGRPRAGTCCWARCGRRAWPRTRWSRPVSSCRARIGRASTIGSAAACSSRSAICRGAWSPSAAAASATSSRSTSTRRRRPLYSKGSLLYAADLARDTIRERNRALIVEGYVDCLMAHQYGFTETVAALGTAFTATQLAVLRRYCDEVVTFFDADAAGQKAAERAEELLEPTRRRPELGREPRRDVRRRPEPCA